MANNLLSAWGTVGSVLLAILILLVMITIHEFGHYVAGKIFKFKINEFSIGFGPALFKHKSKKSGEIFAVRLIPLGGFCAFEGEDGLEDEPSEKRKEKKAEGEQTERVFEEEGFSEPEPEAKPAEGKETDPDSFTKKPCWQRIIVLVAGAFMNYLLALFFIVVCFFSYGQTMIAVYETEEATGEYVGYSLQDRDIFLKADGRNLYLTTDIVRAVNGKKQGDLVEFLISRVVDVVTETDEEGNEITKNVRETMTVTVMLRSDVEVKNSADVSSAWAALGVRFDEESGNYLLANSLYRFGFWETIGRSFVYSFKIAGSILKVLGELLTGKLGISAFGGPITTISMTSQIVSRGFRYFLEIAGYIGVNLAVFNLLPIPALDGCKVIFTLIEWIRGKPISRKVEAIVNAAGFIFLLGFAILVDILQFV